MHVDAESKAAAWFVDESTNQARPVLLLQRVLETTDSVLDLALNLVGLAVSLQLGIACRFADGLLD
jgi:hypothetical protein